MVIFSGCAIVACLVGGSVCCLFVFACLFGWLVACLLTCLFVFVCVLLVVFL